MSFGFSVGDFIAATSIIARTLDLIKTSGAEKEFHEAYGHLSELDDVLRKIESVGLDNLKPKEIEVVQDTVEECQPINVRLLNVIERKYETVPSGRGVRSTVRRPH